MKKIQILGTGCAKCQQLASLAEDTASALGVDFEIEKVTDFRRIASFGVMATPAMVVDGVVRTSGRLPSSEEMKQLLG